ncbi:hypothetical protein [Psychrobacter aestuarii]|uniref:Uncharacterized protein n=1 Tax=Psychrobacter aestuarii TaxID=556327 RepID=A0ABN0VN08_9GAMM|nr:hypothetical protein [Psychrobacter aestuarii]
MTALTSLKTATAIGILTLGLVGCSQPSDEASAAPDAAAQTDTADTHADEHGAHEGEAEHGAHEAHGEHEGHDEHGAHEGHEGHDHGHADMTNYACQPEQRIGAHYDEHDGKMSAHLLIDGVEYDLLATSGENTDPAIGGIYDTDIGLSDDAGMRWEVTADKSQATLVSLPTDAQGSDEKVLFECDVTKG